MSKICYESANTYTSQVARRCSTSVKLNKSNELKVVTDHIFWSFWGGFVLGLSFLCRSSYLSPPLMRFFSIVILPGHCILRNRTACLGTKTSEEEVLRLITCCFLFVSHTHEVSFYIKTLQRLCQQPPSNWYRQERERKSSTELSLSLLSIDLGKEVWSPLLEFARITYRSMHHQPTQARNYIKYLHHRVCFALQWPCSNKTDKTVYFFSLSSNLNWE